MIILLIDSDWIIGYVDLNASYLDKTAKKLRLCLFNVDDPMILKGSWICKNHAILQSDGSKLKVLVGEEKKKTVVLGAVLYR